MFSEKIAAYINKLKIKFIGIDFNKQYYKKALKKLKGVN